MDKDILRSAVNGTKRAGQTSLIKYLKGGRLTQRQAIAAKCYDCNGMGESDICDLDYCALYPYSPYRPKSLVRAVRATGDKKKGI
jgi:hypothetical protein